MKKILFLCLTLMIFISCLSKGNSSALANDVNKVRKSSQVKAKMIVNGNYSYAGISVAYVLLENGKVLVFSSASNNPLSVMDAKSLLLSGVMPGLKIETPEDENSNVNCYFVCKGSYSYASVDVIYVLYKNGTIKCFGNYTNAPFTLEEARILLSPTGISVTYYE